MASLVVVWNWVGYPIFYTPMTGTALQFIRWLRIARLLIL